MNRVIDDDEKAMEIINKWRRKVDGLNYTLHTNDFMLRDLRAEVPNWWGDIDHLDHTTWVDCIVGGHGIETKRAYVKEVIDGYFYIDVDDSYSRATPFRKEK